MSSRIKQIILLLLFCLAVSLIVKTDSIALDKKTSSAISHYIMGVISEGIGDIDTAIQEYKKSLKFDEEASVIHLNLASSYIKKDNIPEAIDELKTLIRLDPEVIEPHAILALLYTSQDKLREAAEEYETTLKKASKLQPKNIEIYKSLGALYLQQKKYKEAEGAYKLIIELAPENPEAHFYLGNIYNELKKNNLSENELKETIRLKPDFPEALNYLGYLWAEENKNLDQAETMIKKALQADPDNGAYIDSLGWVYFRRGKFKEAVKELERAGSLLEDPVIYDHLGDAHLKVNDKEKAKLNWQKSLKLSPGQEKIREKLEKINK